MLSKSMYTEEYIRDLQKQTGNDPTLLETVIYAFGLLEAIRNVGLSFCFKGGTALMVLLNNPKRLSTDIDIIVNPGVNVDDYIKEAGKIFPFTEVKENIRNGANDIEKRHFKFKYCSPRTGHDISILLDVVFETIPDEQTIMKPIKNKLLLTEGEDLTVKILDVNSILGDKLTAFAPHTTGVSFGEGKELEVIKQLYDCGTLFDAMTDYTEVKQAYNRIVISEMGYKGLKCSPKEVLEDTIGACLCIASRGEVEKDEYYLFKDGINRIRNHIIGDKFNGEVAGAYASRVLYLAASLYVGRDAMPRINDPSRYLEKKPEIRKAKSFSYIRFVDSLSYAYLIDAVHLLQNTKFI